MNFRKLPLRNLLRKPGRTAVLLILVTLLSASLFGGSVILSSLRSGMHQLEDRLGADIIVVPSSAKSKINVNQMLLSGTTGYFYMKSDILDEVRARDGVMQASAQLYLASLKASCCSVAVQVIGFDPETDFSVQPWIAQSYQSALNDLDVVVGSRVSAPIGEDIRIYEQNCHVVARLESTGTEMDTAIYTTIDTVRILLNAASDLGHDLKISGDPQEVISAIYVKVDDEVTSVESVENDINLHIRKVEAVSAKSMLSGVSDSMAGVAGTMKVLLIIIWITVFLILLLAFVMITRERKKEFALLRMLGASRGMVSGVVVHETGILCLAGTVLGIVLSAAAVFPFSGLIEDRLGLPFLTPGAPELLKIGIFTLIGVLLVGAIAAAWSVLQLGKTQTSTVLREGI